MPREGARYPPSQGKGPLPVHSRTIRASAVLPLTASASSLPSVLAGPAPAPSMHVASVAAADAAIFSSPSAAASAAMRRQGSMHGASWLGGTPPEDKAAMTLRGRSTGEEAVSRDGGQRGKSEGRANARVLLTLSGPAHARLLCLVYLQHNPHSQLTPWDLLPLVPAAFPFLPVSIRTPLCILSSLYPVLPAPSPPCTPCSMPLLLPLTSRTLSAAPAALVRVRPLSRPWQQRPLPPAGPALPAACGWRPRSQPTRQAGRR